MKVTHISEFGHQLTRFGLLNSYLVREPDGYTLIDTTIGGAGKSILAAARTLGAPIRRILLTHAHGDHVGSVDELVKALPGIDVLASSRAVPLLKQPPNKSIHPDEPSLPIRGDFPGIRTAVNTTVVPGGRIGALRAIATPGHTPDHFSFLDERDGTLYAGDALIAVGRLTLTHCPPWYFPVPRLVTWSKSIALRSGENLLEEHAIQRFACGHGAFREGGIATLRQAIAAASATASQSY